MIKKWSGRDPLSARLLHHNPITMIPHFTIVVQLNNCPQMSDDSDGTLRRLVNVEFNSKFTQNPKYEHEFKIDTSLPDKFDGWKLSFFHVLCEYYKKYIEIVKEKGALGAVMPESIKVNSKELLFGEDPVRIWFDKYIKEEPGSILTMGQIKEHFTEWFEQQEWEEDRNITRKEILIKVSKWIGLKPVKRKLIDYKEYNSFWVGFKIS